MPQVAESNAIKVEEFSVKRRRTHRLSRKAPRLLDDSKYRPDEELAETGVSVRHLKKVIKKPVANMSQQT